MAKYYLVPVTARDIKINGKTFFEMLENIDEKLYKRELRRVQITYENPLCKHFQESGLIDEFNNITKLIYRKKRIPEKLIIKEDDYGLFEFVSEKEIQCDNPLYLKVYEANIDDIKECMNNSSYDDKVLRFIKLGLKNKKTFFKRKNSVKRSK